MLTINHLGIRPAWLIPTHQNFIFYFLNDAICKCVLYVLVLGRLCKMIMVIYDMYILYSSKMKTLHVYNTNI